MISATMPNTELLEQIGRKRAHLAEHGLQAGIAGQRHGRELDGEIAQIERVADGEEADDQQPLHLIRRQPERGLFHAANMAGNRACGTSRRASCHGQSSRNATCKPL